MQAGQVIRRTGRSVAQAFDWVGGRLSYNERGTGWRLTRRVLIAVGVAIPLYYLVGMLLVHEIDDNPDEAIPPALTRDGGSEAVATVEYLVRREIERNAWVSNDPFFMPGYFLDNMQNYQQGLFAALSRFTIELNDFLGRTRGSSEIDPDLAIARRLNQPGDIWVWQPSKSIWPQRTSESIYAEAADGLNAYNARVASGAATYERRTDNLAATLDRISKDIGSTSASLFKVTQDEPGWYLFDWSSDDLFYTTKGKVYGYYMILRALEKDFERIIAERELGSAYDQMMDSLRAVLELEPLVVVNGAPGSQFTPNHLTDQGFYLLRARTQMREIIDILRA